MINTTEQQRQQLKADNKKWPKVLTEVPRFEWPNYDRSKLLAVWRSCDFLVQVFHEGGGVIRLSVNRTQMRSTGRWAENITWDELQQIKRECGYGDKYAVEVYPRDVNAIDVASMRHLWILDKPLPIGWEV